MEAGCGIRTRSRRPPRWWYSTRPASCAAATSAGAAKLPTPSLRRSNAGCQGRSKVPHAHPLQGVGLPGDPAFSLKPSRAVDQNGPADLAALLRSLKPYRYDGMVLDALAGVNRPGVPL